MNVSAGCIFPPPVHRKWSSLHIFFGEQTQAMCLARTRAACMQLAQCQREQLKGLCLHQHAATRRILALKPPILSLLLLALHQYIAKLSLIESTPMVLSQGAR